MILFCRRCRYCKPIVPGDEQSRRRDRGCEKHSGVEIAFGGSALAEIHGGAVLPSAGRAGYGVRYAGCMRDLGGERGRDGEEVELGGAEVNRHLFALS